LAEEPNYKHESNRNFRFGYMAAVIRLANFVTKHAASQDVQEYTAGLGSDWTNFVENELKKSNETNNKSLGGQQPRHSMDEDDNDNHYEVNMEKIMQRFSNYNQLSMSSSNQDEEEEDTEGKKGETEEGHEEENDKHNDDLFKDLEQNHNQFLSEVQAHIEQQEEVPAEFNQCNYWKLPESTSLEELMKEMSL
jgi:hypothetical protein